jgi:hypothetical protein
MRRQSETTIMRAIGDSGCGDGRSGFREVRMPEGITAKRWNDKNVIAFHARFDAT